MISGVATVVAFALCFANIQIRNCINSQNTVLRSRFEPLKRNVDQSDDTALLLPIRCGSRH